jgi:hypothetical protein
MRAPLAEGNDLRTETVGDRPGGGGQDVEPAPALFRMAIIARARRLR